MITGIPSLLSAVAILWISRLVFGSV